MKTYKDILEYIRNYKAEYKKFQSSPERIKYRAELVKYNRDNGTYGNRDKKDASHKGGKIVGFEAQSKNRGRAEASRLKKENDVSTKKSGVPKKGKGVALPKPAGKTSAYTLLKKRFTNVRAVSATVGVKG